MSSAGSVVYLHGIGGVRDDWSAPLLQVCEGAELIAARYADLLDPAARATPVRAQARPRPAASDADRTAYLVRQRELAGRIRSESDALAEGIAWPSGLPRPGDLSSRLPLARMVRSSLFGLDQVGRYLDDADRRAAVVDRVLPALVDSARPRVVVAHSLGSIVVLDALTDPRVDIDLLLTLGSPLGHEAIHGEMPVLDSFPYHRIGSWLNVVSILDPVPLGRGLHPRFPAAHDVFVTPVTGRPTAESAVSWAVDTVGRAATAHLDTTYLSSPTVRAAIGHSLQSGGDA